MKPEVTLFWHRRDLRIDDNAALAKALNSETPVLPLFIFDRRILDQLPKADARVEFIHCELSALKKQYEEHGGSLLIKYNTPDKAWEEILKEYKVASVFTNRDYEPYAKERDQHIHTLLSDRGIPFKGCKDQVIFEKSEVVKNDGKPYTVFTPYMKKWKAALTDASFEAHPSAERLGHLYPCDSLPMPSLESMGFTPTSVDFPNKSVDTELLKKYTDRRDLPAVQGTSRLSVHLRFGTVSIRALARKGQQHAEKWLNELIWRDFYQMILYHFPDSANKAFKSNYDQIPWRNAPEDFERWCEGKTGYPIVDAGMRELNATGFMHNRVRMVTASFLTKHLLIDWRLGERYFAEKLLDFDLASNVGGWQWAAGSGCDAAPYFRVFNPSAQQEKFDPKFEYIKKWVPEYGTANYPEPMVEHKFARNRAIETYKAALA